MLPPDLAPVLELILAFPYLYPFNLRCAYHSQAFCIERDYFTAFANKYQYQPDRGTHAVVEILAHKEPKLREECLVLHLGPAVPA